MRKLEDIFSSKKKEYALVILFFFLASLVFTWPLILHVHNRILGGHGDTLLNTWIISWDANTLFTHPSQLFQGNIIYPARDVLAYSETMLTLGVLAAPVIHIFRNPILAYNFLVFFGFVCSAFGCYLLIKELTGSRWGGVAGGLFFAFCPYKIARLSQLQILFSAFLPFAMLYLFRFFRLGRKRNLVLFALFFLLQSMVSWHYLVFCSMAIGLLWVWTALFSRTRTEWLRLAAVAVASLLVVVSLVPLALPYLRARERLPGFSRSLFESQLYAARPVDYLRVLPFSPIYGDAPFPFQRGDMGSEFVLYPGAVVVILALAGLLLRRRRDDDPYVFESYPFRRGALFFLVLTALSAILTFGPTIGGAPNLLYRIPWRLGLFRFIRVPTRFYALVALGLAVLAGYGVAKMAARLNGRGGNPHGSDDEARGGSPTESAVIIAGGGDGENSSAKCEVNHGGGWKAGRITAIALVLILALEIVSCNQVTFMDVPVYGSVPEVYTWLREQGDVKIIELPTEKLDAGWRYDRELVIKPRIPYEYYRSEGFLVYLSTYHWKKTVNGYSGYQPFFYNRIITEMQGFPSARAVDLLQGLGIDYVIWHWGGAPVERREEVGARLASTPGLTRVKDFGADSVFGVEKGNTVAPGDLLVEAVAPDIMRPGEMFNLGVYVTNTGDSPFVAIEEEPQPFRLSFLSASGEEIYQEQGDYRAPFFLEPGESQALPLQSRGSPGEGDYRLRVSLEGGILGAREFILPATVRDIPALSEPGNLAGSVGYSEEGILMVPVADGLFPLAFQAVNTGDTLWTAAVDQRKEEPEYPGSIVRLGVIWYRDGESVWEEQRCTLPCDVSPGQSVAVPSLLRAPDAPGRYNIAVYVVLEGEEWFGNGLQLEVEIVP